VGIETLKTEKYGMTLCPQCQLLNDLADFYISAQAYELPAIGGRH